MFVLSVHLSLSSTVCYINVRHVIRILLRMFLHLNIQGICITLLLDYWWVKQHLYIVLLVWQWNFLSNTVSNKIPKHCNKIENNVDDLFSCQLRTGRQPSIRNVKKGWGTAIRGMLEIAPIIRLHFVISIHKHIPITIPCIV